MDKAISDYWRDNYVNGWCGLCSLCGNTGVIDTQRTAISLAGVHAGRLNYCICPNGQTMRENHAPLTSEHNQA